MNNLFCFTATKRPERYGELTSVAAVHAQEYNKTIISITKRKSNRGDALPSTNGIHEFSENSSAEGH